MWTLFQFTLGSQHEGHVTGAVEIGEYWSKPEADAECSRLAALDDNTDILYEVIECTATGVYPADESPPWIHNGDQLRKRGYEDPLTDRPG